IGGVLSQRSPMRQVCLRGGLSAGVDPGSEAEEERPAMMERPSFGRVAVIHDWLTGMRGGEHVLEAILDLVPDAELFTLFHFLGSVSTAIESHIIHTSGLQKLAT